MNDLKSYECNVVIHEALKNFWSDQFAVGVDIDLTVDVARDLVRRGIWEGKLAPEMDVIPA